MKLSKNLHVWNYKAQGFHIWYIASSRGSLPKLFKLCPWGMLHCDLWPFPQVSDPGTCGPSCHIKHFVFYSILKWNINQFVILFIFTWSKLIDTGLWLIVISPWLWSAFWNLFCPRLLFLSMWSLNGVLFKCIFVLKFFMIIFIRPKWNFLHIMVWHPSLRLFVNHGIL